MDSITETYGQYAIDHIIHAGNPALRNDPDKVKAMRGDGNPAMHHPIALFDEKEGRLDEDSGQIIQADDADTQNLGGEGMRFVDDSQLRVGRTVLRLKDPAVNPELERATRDWLRANSPKSKRKNT